MTGVVFLVTGEDPVTKAAYLSRKVAQKGGDRGNRRFSRILGKLLGYWLLEETRTAYLEVQRL